MLKQFEWPIQAWWHFSKQRFAKVIHSSYSVMTFFNMTHNIWLHYVSNIVMSNSDWIKIISALRALLWWSEVILKKLVWQAWWYFSNQRLISHFVMTFLLDMTDMTWLQYVTNIVMLNSDYNKIISVPRALLWWTWWWWSEVILKQLVRPSHAW